MKHKREAFITHYINTKNATQSAIKAGYSPHSAGITGSRLLKDAYIRGEIEKGIAKELEDNRVTEENVIRNVLRIAHDASRTTDKLKAWELLGKYLSLWRDNEQKTTIGLFQGLNVCDTAKEEIGNLLNMKELQQKDLLT